MMGIAPAHLEFHDEIMALPGFLADPIRIIGVQEIFGNQSTRWPQLTWETPAPTLRDLLLSQGFNDVKELDLHDHRAEIHWDLNQPMPGNWDDSAQTLIDFGSIEHIANSVQVLESYLRMTRVGGHICIHTPVKGFCGHGLHTFSPEFIIETLKQNGCEVVYLKYSTDGSTLVEVTMDEKTKVWRFPNNEHVLIWIVVRKTRLFSIFHMVQQAYYA